MTTKTPTFHHNVMDRNVKATRVDQNGDRPLRCNCGRATIGARSERDG